MNLKEIREKYPQYNDKSDEELANALHKKYYSEMPVEDFYAKINYESTPQDVSEQVSYSRPGWQEVFKESLKQLHPEREYSEQVSKARETPVGMALETIPAFFLPGTSLGKAGTLIEQIPKLGKYLKPATEQALSQGLYAGLISPENKGIESGLTAGAFTLPFSTLSQAALSGSPTLRTLSKMGLGAGGAALGGLSGYETAKAVGLPEGASAPLGALTGGLAGILGYRAGSPFRTEQEKIVKALGKYPYQERLGAAERLGLEYITPAEATGSKYLGKLEGGMGKTPEGASTLLERAEARESSETKAIDNLLKTIFDPNHPIENSKKINELYKVAESKNVPLDKLKNLENNEIFKKAVKDMQKSAAYREELKGVDKNSIQYLDKIKESLYDMAESAPSREARKIDKVRKQIVDLADKSSPEYKEARSLAERQLTRQNIEKFFDKRRREGIPMGQLLKSEAGMQELQMHLRNVPEAQQQLKDMKLVFEKLIPSQSARAAAALAGTSMDRPRSFGQYAERFIEEKLFSSKNDKALVELITNPKWADELKKLEKVSNKEELLSKLIDLVGKAGGQVISKSESED